MRTTTSDQILERLHQWGVRRVFGYPGDGINGLMGAFGRIGDKMQFVQARHEELAAFMACAHAKYTGEVGVCMATSGPGAIHLLNGLYDAKADHQPVVAIVGQTARAAMGGDYQQEVDLHTLFKDVAHEYVQTAMVPAQIRHLVDRAFRIARDQRSVTCLIVPHDLQELEAVEKPPRKHGTVHSGIGMTGSRSVPGEDALRAAADVLNAGRKVAILAGAGALHATDELLAVADRLGAGIAKALLGKFAVPDDVPCVTGSIGLLGTQPSWELMSQCDTLLMVGSSFPYSEFLPKEGQARGVQIDLDGRRLSIRYPMEINLVGDSRLTLQALLPMLQRKDDREWQQGIESSVRKWWEVLEARAMNEAKPINPQRVFWELSPLRHGRLVRLRGPQVRRVDGLRRTRAAAAGAPGGWRDADRRRRLQLPRADRAVDRAPGMAPGRTAAACIETTGARENAMKAKVINEGPERTIALIFDQGDEVIANVERFANDHGLSAARFTAIGAFQQVTLGYFDWERKDYERIAFDEQLEVLSLIGDVALDGTKAKVHAHVVLGRRDATALGGHLLEARVRPTLEVLLVESPGYLRRTCDPASGLTLIDIGAPE